MPKKLPQDTDSVHIKVISDNTDIALLPAFHQCKHLSVNTWSKGIQHLSQIVQQECVDILYLSAPPCSDDLLHLCEILEDDTAKDLSIFIISSPKRDAFIKQAYQLGVKAFINLPIVDIHFEHQLQKCTQIVLHQKSRQQLYQSKVDSHQLVKLCDFKWNVTQQTFELSPEAKKLLHIKTQNNTVSQLEFLQALHEIGRLTTANFFNAIKQGQSHIQTKIQVPFDTFGFSDVFLIAQLTIAKNQDILYQGCLQNIGAFNKRQGSNHHLAYHDSLTGLANRRYLMEHLQNLVQQNEHEAVKFSLLFLDLDGFKRVNDQLGHSTGDLLLVEVTQHLQKVASKDAFIARLGGDEFCIVIVYKNLAQQGQTLAKKILADFKHSLFLEQYKIHTSFSIGVACFPLHGNNITELLKAADTAMYEAKSKGKKCFELYSPLLTEKTIKRITLEKEIYHAYQHEQFELYYQPQINLITQKIVGVEALIRWIHPTKGMISPDQFIPVTEETRQINKIGEWVLNKACADGKLLHDKGLQITIAVNVSPVQLHYGNFYEKVANALKRSGLEPQYLELEITESTFQVSDNNIDVFNQLRKLGVQLAIDDFGTGYSNLASLNQLPVDILKIDREFIKDIPEDHAIAALTGSIIGMAKIRQLKIIAEGIETIEQIQYLQGVNCDIAQGFFIGRPMEFSQIKLFLKRQQSSNHNILSDLKAH